MSTVSPHFLSPQPARARSDSLGARWERLLAVASVCLPIPLLAATGLSIPLPSSVERIGAALVAWADQAPEGAPLPASGDIVLTDNRQAAPESREQVAPPARAALAQAVTASAPTSTGGAPAKSGGKGGGNDGSGSTGSGGSTPAAEGGGTTPPAQPGPIEGTVNEVTKATQPVVDVVEDTVGVVDETVGGVEKTVDELTGDLLGGGGLLGGGKGGGGLLGSGK